MKQNGKNEKNNSGRKKTDGALKGRITLIVILAIAAVVLAGAAAGVTYVNRLDTIFPNVTVDDLDISGLTLSETAELLKENGYGDLGDDSVTVDLPAGCSLTVATRDVCTETPVSDIALMAWDACKGGSAMQDGLTYLKCLTGGMALKSGSAITVDEPAVRAAVDNAVKEVQLALLDSKLTIGENSICVIKGAQSCEIDADAITGMIVDAFNAGNYATLTYEAEIIPNQELNLQEIYDTVYAESADAYYDKETREVIPEVRGISFDMEAAQKLWDSAAYGDKVVIPVLFEEPEVTKAALRELIFRDMLSSMTTSLWGSTDNRINNVTKAASSINDIILMPGEEFSYNPALGKRTAENGYLLAGAYAGGEVVQEYGGGICQVSSTLYYCCLYANLKITDRCCHYFPVGYLPAGLDATVSWGGPEFKFVNDREYPVKIVAYVSAEDHSVTVELWGTDVDGSYVEMNYSTWFFYDKEWTDVILGYKAQTYRCVYDKDGNLLSRQAEALSTYNYHEEDIKWPEEALEAFARKEAEERGEPWPPETPEPSEIPEVPETPVPTETPDETDPPASTETPAETESPAETQIPLPTETPDAELPPNETPPLELEGGEAPVPTAPVTE